MIAASNGVDSDEKTTGYYGSFPRGKKYHAILDYADKRNLKYFLGNQCPPLTMENVFRFRDEILKLLCSSQCIHNHFGLQERAAILQGYVSQQIYGRVLSYLVINYADFSLQVASRY